MKELELKQIAPYLPYELKLQFRFKKEKIFLLSAYDECKSEIQTILIDEALNSYYKPILRPMSDLNKEIEVNGETFTPAERIKKMYPSDTFSSTSNAAQWSYRIVQKLLEWHFDVYGLIDENLAININEL